jgi:hypothetical protein
MSKARQMMQEAERWVGEGRLDEATERYAWLWDNILSISQGMGGVRSSFMVGDMTRLAARHAPAKQRFAQLRDIAAARMEQDDDETRAVLDWINLNDVVGEPEKTLAWFDKARQSMDFHAHYPHIGVVFRSWLERHGRWADSAFFVHNGREDIEEQYHHWKLLDSMMLRRPEIAARPEMADVHARMFRGRVASTYASLLAAGREREADDALAAARGYAPGAELLLQVLGTLADVGSQGMHVVRDSDLKLIDELPEGPARDKIRRRLEGK